MLLLGIKPIFVLEGKAPVIKYKTIQQRRDLQCKSKPHTTNYVELGKRSRIHTLQKQVIHLKYPGIHYNHKELYFNLFYSVKNFSSVWESAAFTVMEKQRLCVLYSILMV